MIRLCWRYRTIDRMMERLVGEGEISVAAFADVLDAAHQEAVYLGEGVLLNTVHSNVFDLQTNEITLYYWFQFDNPLTLTLEDELAKGAQRVRVGSLFSAELVARAEAINIAHLDRIERWRTFPWLSTAIVLAAMAALLGLLLLWR